MNQAVREILITEINYYFTGTPIAKAFESVDVAWSHSKLDWVFYMTEQAYALLRKDYMLQIIFFRGHPFCGDLSTMKVSHSKEQFRQLKGN